MKCFVQKLDDIWLYPKHSNIKLGTVLVTVALACVRILGAGLPKTLAG